MLATLLGLLLAPALITATSLEYYRSAQCDARGTNFFLDRYGASEPLFNEEGCRPAPARTVAVKLLGSLNPACIVLAYDDDSCESLVGRVLASGKCLAASKAKIGSWQVECNGSPESLRQDAPGELMRRGTRRVPLARKAENMTISSYAPCATNATRVTTWITKDILTTVNGSSANDVAASITSSASVRAAVGSAINSESAVTFNGTFLGIAASNSSYTMSNLRTTISPAAVTSTGARKGSGTAVLHVGGSPSNQMNSARVLATMTCGILAVMGLALA